MVFTAIYVFMEWLFYVTTPSFLSALEPFETMVVLIASLTVAELAFVTIFAALTLLHLLAARFGILKAPLLPALVPALILGALALILLDNFTYTVLHRGIVHTSGAARVAYSLGFLVIFAGLLWQQSSRLHTTSMLLNRAGLGIIILAIGGAVAIADKWYAQYDNNIIADAPSKRATSRPNILFLAFDGVPAARMSAYGYQRDTTPFLSEVRNNALFLENAFSNNGKTTGSIASLLTGRLPITNKVINYPHVLRGDDTFRHFPLILKRQGYYAFQVSPVMYSNARIINMNGAFDSINYSGPAPGIFSPAFPSDIASFVYAVFERITARLGHITYIAKMHDVMSDVEPTIDSVPESRLADTRNNLAALIKSIPEPFFGHIHLVSTHCCVWHPENTEFTSGKPRSGSSYDYLDGAIRDADDFYRSIFEWLDDEGLLERTILVISSDHGLRHSVTTKIPLIMRFPHGEHAGTIRENVQLLDVVPTLLDHMHLDIPEWIHGRSLLSASLDPLFPVISTDGKGPAENMKIHRIYAIVCDRWHSMDAGNKHYETGSVEHHSAPCNEHAGSDTDWRNYLDNILSDLGLPASAD